MYRRGCRFIQCKISGSKMKETDTMQSYKYLQAIFGDKWVDWGVSVGFLLLIASWFVPRNTVDFLVDFIVTGLMLVVAIRIGCVIVRVRRGDELSRESARSVRFLVAPLEENEKLSKTLIFNRNQGFFFLVTMEN